MCTQVYPWILESNGGQRGGGTEALPPPGIEKKIDRMKRAYSKYIINFSLGGKLFISESTPQKIIASLSALAGGGRETKNRAGRYF